MFESSKNYKAGDQIIKEGEASRDLYILLSGILEVSVEDNADDIIVSEIESPEILGEISFLNGTPRTASVKAKTDAEVYILSYNKVKEELSEIPIWFKMILLAFTKRIRVCGDRIKEYDQKVKELEARLARIKSIS
jgi:CRP-like cAMP-binding protein